MKRKTCIVLIRYVQNQLNNSKTKSQYRNKGCCKRWYRYHGVPNGIPYGITRGILQTRSNAKRGGFKGSNRTRHSGVERLSWKKQDSFNGVPLKIQSILFVFLTNASSISKFCLFESTHIFSCKLSAHRVVCMGVNTLQKTSNSYSKKIIHVLLGL